MKGRGFARRLARLAKRPAVELELAALALVSDAGAARKLRDYQRDPNVAALTVARSRDWLDSIGWVLLGAGLTFTTINVAAFVGGWSGWLVEPLVMGLMLVLMRGEQIANRHEIEVGGWVQFTRRASLMITYVMNTWQAYLDGSPKQIFIHSVPPLLVWAASEALVQQRQALTRVVRQVESALPLVEPVPAPQAAVEAVSPSGPVQETPEVPAERSDGLSGPRTLVEQAYQAYRALREEGIEPTPSQVDDRAEVRRGTSKVTGRMAKFAVRYAQEVTDGTAGDTEATG